MLTRRRYGGCDAKHCTDAPYFAAARTQPSLTRALTIPSSSAPGIGTETDAFLALSVVDVAAAAVVVSVFDLGLRGGVLLRATAAADAECAFCPEFASLAPFSFFTAPPLLLPLPFAEGYSLGNAARSLLTKSCPRTFELSITRWFALRSAERRTGILLCSSCLCPLSLPGAHLSVVFLESS